MKNRTEVDAQDAKFRRAELKWGKYGVLHEHDHPNGKQYWLKVCSWGHPYSHVWSAVLYGIKNQGWEVPNDSNNYRKCCVIDLTNGEIVWRNYE